MGLFATVQVNTLASLFLDYFPSLDFLAILNYPVLNKFVFCLCQPEFVSVVISKAK
jgi:hypothetical protein